jgi:hypothetical protein
MLIHNTLRSVLLIIFYKINSMQNYNMLLIKSYKIVITIHRDKVLVTCYKTVIHYRLKEYGTDKL